MKKSELNAIVNAVITLRTGATDALATTAKDLYPRLTNSGAVIPDGTRILWTDGELYIAQYTTYDRDDTDPEHDTNGWARLDYRDGYRMIPSAMTTATMFHMGERGWWNDTLFESLINNNSWTPSDYPAGWLEVLE